MDTKQQPDNIKHPPHYTQGSIECIDAIEQVVAHYPPDMAYHVGCILKYLWRAPHKGTFVQDLKKAHWYLERALETTAEW
jgi:hypothetical protein